MIESINRSQDQCGSLNPRRSFVGRSHPRSDSQSRRQYIMKTLSTNAASTKIRLENLACSWRVVFSVHWLYSEFFWRNPSRWMPFGLFFRENGSQGGDDDEHQSP